MPRYHKAFLIAAALLSSVLADSNDWVNVQYVLQQAKLSPTKSSTSNAQNVIIAGAGSSAKRGPWSVANANGILPPSHDPHDYLSWAPYHWPNCNWCPHGRVRLVNGSNGTGDGSGTSPSSDQSPADSDPYSEEVSESDSNAAQASDNAHVKLSFGGPRAPSELVSNDPVSVQSLAVSIADVPVGGPPPIRTQVPTNAIPGPASGSQTTARVGAGTPAPAMAPARTTKDKEPCTPSSTSLAPSSTWTTCKYVVRDGQVNSDVRTLNGPHSINAVSQSVLYNALAYVLRRSDTHARNVVQFIDAFFLAPTTRMNPSMEYGQVVRGPGKKGQMGTFTGILDLRGVTKICNAAMLMKAAKSVEWTPEVEMGIKDWMVRYQGWMQTSALGQSTASRPNNHGSFYVNQLAAAKILAGDNTGAAETLKDYFGHQFLDQIAASGEQPFEAVRTRPFHYRCFNLEAMITNAKLGDQLGLDFWSARSKYGATIQTAVDYAMSVKRGREEDVAELAPHVAAVAAAYGDPRSKYATWLSTTMPEYQSAPWWFYDQTEALGSAPAARGGERARRFVRWARGYVEGEECETSSRRRGLPMPFECPAVFSTGREVEIDAGIFVTCDELRPFYELSSPL